MINQCNFIVHNNLAKTIFLIFLVVTTVESNEYLSSFWLLSGSISSTALTISIIKQHFRLELTPRNMIFMSKIYMRS